VRRVLCWAGQEWLARPPTIHSHEWVSIDADVDGLGASVVFEAQRWAVQEWLMRRDPSG
jgi:hypothetical protein